MIHQKPILKSILLHSLVACGLLVSVHFHHQFLIPTHQQKIVFASLVEMKTNQNHKTPSPILKVYPKGNIRNHPETESVNTAQMEPKKHQVKKISGKDLNKLIIYLYEKIAAHRTYPSESQELNQSGKVLLSFNVLPSGFVNHLKIVHSSGYALLDEAALNAVQKAQPFGLAKQFIHHSQSFEIPIYFAEQA